MTAPVSDVQLADLRRRELARMVDTCTIVSRTRTEDEALGYTIVETLQENVPCYRKANLAGNTETPFGGQLQSGLNWLFVFPYGTVITTDDEIIYGTERFAVMGVLGPRTLELARRVIAIEKGVTP